jgi:hypothetical protein
LIYTNHNDQFAFSGLLDKLAVKHTGFSVKRLPHQRFSIETAQRYATELTQGLVYVSGPEKMVNSVAAILITVRVKEKNIKRDLFTGYKE